MDPATACGWAADFGGVTRSGCWKLRGGHRWLDLYRHLETMNEIEPITVVAVERVQFSGPGIRALQINSGLIAVIELWADFRGVRVEGVPVSTLKKWATGKGNAKKDLMVAVAKSRWPGQNIKDDNQADALHILDWVCVEVLKRRSKAVVEVGT